MTRDSVPVWRRSCRNLLRRQEILERLNKRNTWSLTIGSSSHSPSPSLTSDARIIGIAAGAMSVFMFSLWLISALPAQQRVKYHSFRVTFDPGANFPVVKDHILFLSRH